MGIISSILKIRSQNRYKYKRKLPAILLLLLICTPSHYAHAEEKVCIADEYEYEKIMYHLISERIKGVRISRECDILLKVNLPLGLIVGKIEYTNTTSCRHVASIVKDISKYRMSECYSGPLWGNGLLYYALAFGKEE